MNNGGGVGRRGLVLASLSAVSLFLWISCSKKEASSGGRGAAIEKMVANFPQISDSVRRGIHNPVSDYYACRGFLAGSVASCDTVDQFLYPAGRHLTDIGGTHCREVYYQARMIEEALDGSGSLATCTQMDGDKESDSEELKKECLEIMHLYAEGNPPALCRALHRKYPGEEISAQEEEDGNRCVSYHAFIAGREDLCARLENPYKKEHCSHFARLVRSYKEERPEYVRGTVFEPVRFPESGNCNGAADWVWQKYEALLKGPTQKNPQ